MCEHDRHHLSSWVCNIEIQTWTLQVSTRRAASGGHARALVGAAICVHHVPSPGLERELIAWVHAECADEARTRIAPLLQLPTETIDFQVAVARTIPTHASGDLLAYGYATASETYGTTVPAAAPSARYMRLVASWQHRTAGKRRHSSTTPLTARSRTRPPRRVRARDGLCVPRICSCCCARRALSCFAWPSRRRLPSRRR